MAGPKKNPCAKVRFRDRQVREQGKKGYEGVRGVQGVNLVGALEKARVRYRRTYADIGTVPNKRQTNKHSQGKP